MPDNPSHPVWCDRQASACDGRCHESTGIVLPGGDSGGPTMRAALRGTSERLFVELSFVSAQANDEAVAAILRGVGDAELVTDPHAHDIALSQAEALHRALGEMLAWAGGGCR
jgi:hypothetical protein